MTTIGVVCEGPTDHGALRELCRRSTCEAIQWLDEDNYHSVCPHVGIERGAAFSSWTDLGKSPRRWPRHHAHGKFNGEPGAPMALAARLALLQFLDTEAPPAAVILAKDGDDDAVGRLRGLEQARQERQWPLQVLIAVPVPEIESWYLSGFEPSTAEEHERIATIRQRLGFDPTVNPERLTSKNEADKKDCKRALNELTNNDPEYRKRCLRTTHLETLRTRGAANGLAAFLGELRDRLIPLISGAPPR